jgi:hypothetical protein
MDPERQRRQRRVVAALLAVLALIVLWQWMSWDRPAETAQVAGSTRPQPVQAARRSAPSDAPEDVALETLSTVRPAPSGSGRNPFHFYEPPPPPVPVAKAPTPSVPTGPPSPPPPPPIPLRFIGTVMREGWSGKVAVLSDGKNIFYGRTGDIIDGRYRIVAVGEQSVQVEYVDGRGRQTIRLAG